MVNSEAEPCEDTLYMIGGGQTHFVDISSLRA